MKKNSLCAAVLMSAAIGCGDKDVVQVEDFEGYGAGQPGVGLVHGGQVFFEYISTPTGDIALLNAWARNFPDPQPAPADTLPIPRIPSGTCQNISTPIFPRLPA